VGFKGSRRELVSECLLDKQTVSMNNIGQISNLGHSVERFGFSRSIVVNC